MGTVLQHLQELRSAHDAQEGSIARKAIGWVSAGYLVVASIATWIAIRQGLEGEPFGRDLGIEPLPGFLVGPGTALSGPLVMLLALAVANLLLWRDSRDRHRGATTIKWLGIAFTVGMLAEPVTWDPGTWNRGPLAVIVLANLLLPLILEILAFSLGSRVASRGRFDIEMARRR